MSEVKIIGIIIIWFSLLYGFATTLNCTSPSPDIFFDELEKELFLKKLHRPVKYHSDILNVSIKMTLVEILGVQEKQQSLTTYVWQVLQWKIYGLSWDEKECGTAKVSIPREKLWVPDIHITEFMDEDKSPKTPYVYLFNTGVVFDDRPLRVASTCRLGIYSFPFDIQNCSLTFGPYIHFETDIRMIQETTAAEILKESLEVGQTRGEWELIDIQIFQSDLAISDGNYSQIKYCLILRRRPILYVVNLILPSSFLVTLDVFSFLLPPHSVDRSAFKMTLILGYTVFLLLMNDMLPVTGEEIPVLNSFFSLSFAVMVASLLETLFISNICFHSSHYGAAPHWLRILVLRYIAPVVCFRPIRRTNHVTVAFPEHTKAVTASTISSRDLQNIPGDSPTLDPVMDELLKLSKDLTAIRLQMDKHFQESKTSQEWRKIATVIDRFIFGLYILFICVSFCTMSIIWHLNPHSTN